MSWTTDRIIKGGYSTFFKNKYYQFSGFEKSLRDLEISMCQTLDYIQKLEDKNKQLEDDHWKDDKLQEMKNKLKDMEEKYHNGFPLSKEEKDKINKWKEKHINKYHNGCLISGAIGGNWSYEFLPTSIGTIGVVYCNCCKDKNKEHSEFTFRDL